MRGVACLGIRFCTLDCLDFSVHYVLSLVCLFGVEIGFCVWLWLTLGLLLILWFCGFRQVGFECARFDCCRFISSGCLCLLTGVS